jgi:hypothetical protein
MIKRSIGRIEVEETILSGEIIEEYPDDKYSPSCLIYGMSKAGRHLHVQLSLPPAIIVLPLTIRMKTSGSITESGGQGNEMRFLRRCNSENVRHLQL